MQPDVEFVILLHLNHSSVQGQFYHSDSYVHFFNDTLSHLSDI